MNPPKVRNRMFFYRRLWHHYYDNADAVIYVVDSADLNRLQEAREELDCVLGYVEIID
jgi:GTPase SAR1 family protein